MLRPFGGFGRGTRLLRAQAEALYKDAKADLESQKSGLERASQPLRTVTRSPSSANCCRFFFGEGLLYYHRLQKKKRYPYSNLSGGPRLILNRQACSNAVLDPKFLRCAGGPPARSALDQLAKEKGEAESAKEDLKGLDLNRESGLCLLFQFAGMNHRLTGQGCEWSLFDEVGAQAGMDFNGFQPSRRRLVQKWANTKFLISGCGGQCLPS